MEVNGCVLFDPEESRDQTDSSMSIPQYADLLLRIMKNDANRVAVTGSQTTHTVPKIHSEISALASNRAMVHCERHGISFSKGHHLCARLHARSLFDENKFATSEIPTRF